MHLASDMAWAANVLIEDFNTACRLGSTAAKTEARSRRC
jgi:hypothetical protein